MSIEYRVGEAVIVRDGVGTVFKDGTLVRIVSINQSTHGGTYYVVAGKHALNGSISQQNMLGFQIAQLKKRKKPTPEIVITSNSEAVRRFLRRD